MMEDKHMKPETEVIFEQDGTVTLQTDGGYAVNLKTPVSAAWESVRSIRGSDPDYGWAGNDPAYRKDVSSPEFQNEFKLYVSNPLQRFWFPASPSKAASDCRKKFFHAYNRLITVPVPLMVACEKGDPKTAAAYLRELTNTEISGFFEIVNSMAFSNDVKLEVTKKFAARFSAPQQNNTCQLQREAVL